MTLENPKIPPNLLRIQETFSLAIRIPLLNVSQELQTQKELYPEFIVDEMAPTQILTGKERLSIYNEQYWYRLLALMQSDFPLLKNSLGAWEFNQMAMAYLIQYPSHSPSVQGLGHLLLDFLRGSTPWSTKQNQQMAELDFSQIQCHLLPSKKPLPLTRLAENGLGSMDSIQLSIQPWVLLFEEDWNLMEYRFEKELNPWLTLLPRKGYWVVFRQGILAEAKPLSYGAFQLLGHLKAGKGLQKACEDVVQNMAEEETIAFAESLPLWFKQWGEWGWFSVED